jgi:hypothetical protein
MDHIVRDGLSVVGGVAGMLCMGGALLLYIIGNNEIPRLTAALWITGWAGLLNSTIGPTVSRFVTSVDGMVNDGINNFTGEAFTGALGLIALAPACFWVYQNKIETKQLAVMSLIPPTISLIPGQLGQIATTVVGIVPWGLDWAVTWLFNL